MNLFTLMQTEPHGCKCDRQAGCHQAESCEFTFQLLRHIGYIEKRLMSDCAGLHVLSKDVLLKCVSDKIKIQFLWCLMTPGLKNNIQCQHHV